MTQAVRTSGRTLRLAAMLLTAMVLVSLAGLNEAEAKNKKPQPVNIFCKVGKVCNGNSKNNFLFGTSSSDGMYGKAGNDAYASGAGNDTMIDTAVSNDKYANYGFGTTGVDYIMDLGGKDILNLSAYNEEDVTSYYAYAQEAGSSNVKDLVIQFNFSNGSPQATIVVVDFEKPKYRIGIQFKDVTYIEV